MKKIVIACSALLAACGPDPVPPAPVYQQPAPVQYAQPAPAAAPVIVQAAPAQHDSGMKDMITGAAIGALATHALSGGGSRSEPAAAPVQRVTNTRVIERTVIREVPRPAPVAAPRPTYTTPAAPRPTATPYTAPRISYAPSNRVTPSFSSARRK